MDRQEVFISVSDLRNVLARDAPAAIELVFPDSAGYQTVREIFVKTKTEPLAIARPKTAEDVQTLFRLARSHQIPFSVRSGGHDLLGRSIAKEALVIDMRDLATARVQSDDKTAKLGGGILMGDLVAQLEEQGVITAFGFVPTVGYVGWATVGGYGAVSSRYGLGVDQIVGAKVVNAKGDIVDADDDMLKGIRGAGGNFGIIVELTVKVYPVEKFLMGLLIFDAASVLSSYDEFSKRYNQMQEDLPTELGLQPAVLNHPDHGKIVMVHFTWSSSDHEKGRRYLQQLETFGKLIANTVTESRVSDFLRSMVFPSGVLGSVRTVTFGKLTGSTISIIHKYLEAMPNIPAILYSVHEFQRGPSLGERAGTVFTAREPHYALEIIGNALDEKSAPEAVEWATRFRAELRSSGDQEQLWEKSYLSLTPPEDNSLENIYGEAWDELRRLKKRYDPENVFALAIPRISTEELMNV